MVSRNVALIAIGIALDIAGCTGAASQPQQPFDDNRRRQICTTLLEQQLNPAGAEEFAAMKAMRAAADDASVFDYKDVASLRELLRRALAAKRAIDFYEQVFANQKDCFDGPLAGSLERDAFQARSEVDHWVNLARENLKASNGGH